MKAMRCRKDEEEEGRSSSLRRSASRLDPSSVVASSASDASVVSPPCKAKLKRNILFYVQQHGANTGTKNNKIRTDRSNQTVMDYVSSTQRRNWLYTPDDLDAQRTVARNRALKQTHQTEFTPVMERRLLAHYGLVLLKLCRTLKLPDKVMTSACSYLRRFYVKKSCLEVDPQGIVLTCLYLACKIEDCYLSAERVSNVGGIPEDIILKSELVLLQGLDFDLACHCVFKALAGGASIGPPDVSAREKMERLLVTDAVLLHTPGQLARYCLGATNNDDDSDKDVRRGLDRLHEEGKEAQVAESSEETVKIDKLLKSERKRIK